MSVSVNTNYSAVFSGKTLHETQRTYDKAIERISIGKKTINARDDAAGIAIAGKMEAQIRGLTAGIRHARDGQYMTGAAEGSMREVGDVLQKMRELAVHAASGIASDVHRDYLNLEMASLATEIDNIASTAKFNKRNLLNGDQFSFFTDHKIMGSSITTVATDMATSTLGVQAGTVSIGSGVNQDALSNVVSAIDGALTTIAEKRASLGAVSNRFGHIISNLQNIINNTEQSKGVMIDADYSEETTNLAVTSLLQQGGNAMLGQANAQKKLILTLFNQ